MREFICGVCPEGCRIRVDAEGNVRGNGCPNGAAFARSEATLSGKVFKGSVNVLGAQQTRCGVKSSGKIPDRLVFAAMEALRSITLFAPVNAGQLLISDFLGTGRSLVADEDIEEI